MDSIQIRKIPPGLKITVSRERMVLPPSLQESIEAYWIVLEESGHSFHRGEIFSIKGMTETEEELHVTLERTDFAHFIYGKHCGLPEPYQCRIVAANGLIVTADGFYVLGQMNEHTANPGYIQFVAGGIDPADVKGNEVDMLGSLMREAKEEIGIAADDRNLVSRMEPRYLVDWGHIALIYLVQLTLSAGELQARYHEFEQSLRDRGMRPEFASLVYLSANERAVDDFFTEDARPKWPFLREVLESELNGL